MIILPKQDVKGFVPGDRWEILIEIVLFEHAGTSFIKPGHNGIYSCVSRGNKPQDMLYWSEKTFAPSVLFSGVLL
jgi:hypothetical protein